MLLLSLAGYYDFTTRLYKLTATTFCTRHSTIQINNISLLLLCHITIATCHIDIILQLRTFLPSHRIRIHNRTANLNSIDKLRNIDHITFAQNNIIVATRISQSLLHIYTDGICFCYSQLSNRYAVFALTITCHTQSIPLTATLFIVHSANKTTAFYVSIRSYTTRTFYQITQTLVLFQKRITSTKQHFSRY